MSDLHNIESVTAALVRAVNDSWSTALGYNDAGSEYYEHGSFFDGTPVLASHTGRLVDGVTEYGCVRLYVSFNEGDGEVTMPLRVDGAGGMPRVEAEVHVMWYPDVKQREAQVSIDGARAWEWAERCGFSHTAPVLAD